MTIKFVEASSEREAAVLAVDKTRALMKDKGFEATDIAAYEFAPDDVEAADPNDAVFEAERSFIYYSDG